MKKNVEIKTGNKSMLRNTIFYVIVFIAIFLLSCPISPLNDDWHYLTAPNPDFHFSDMLPTELFWRPFDALFGGFLGKFPALFPMLNRFLVILAHVINAILLEKILKEIGISKKWSIFAVCFFLLSSSTWAVTLSPDALNQAYSNLFGILALYIFLKKGGYSFLLLCSIALLEKESGVSWFFVIPLFNVFLNGKTWKGFINNKKLFKQCVKQVVFSILTIIAYFIVRFALYGDVVLGNNSGTYKLSLFSFSTIKNAVLLFASATTGIDSVALMGNDRSLVLFAITSLLSLIFMLAWIVCVISLIKKKSQLFPLVCIILCAIGLSLPLMILGSAGEMHAYPVLFCVAIVYAFVFGHANINYKRVLCPIICIFIAFGISSVHKITSIYDYSNRTIELTQNLKSVYDDPDDSNLMVLIDDWRGYSVFDQSAVYGTHYGDSMRPYFGWKELDHYVYSAKSEEDADVYIKDNQDNYDHVFIIRGEMVEKLK